MTKTLPTSVLGRAHWRLWAAILSWIWGLKVMRTSVELLYHCRLLAASPVLALGEEWARMFPMFASKKAPFSAVRAVGLLLEIHNTDHIVHQVGPNNGPTWFTQSLPRVALAKKICPKDLDVSGPSDLIVMVTFKFYKEMETSQTTYWANLGSPCHPEPSVNNMNETKQETGDENLGAYPFMHYKDSI